MKRIIPVLLITILCLSLHSQDDRSIRIGFTASPNTSWITPDSDFLTKESNRIGFSYGLLFDFKIGNNSNYAFATGLLVNSHGGSFINDEYHDDELFVSNAELQSSLAAVEETYRLQYLDIPLALKLKTNEIGYLTYFGQFGLDLSFNIRARQDVDGAFPNDTRVTIDDRNASSDINIIRMGLLVGAGAEYNISGSTYLMVGITYNNGLTGIFNRKEVKTLVDNGVTRPDAADNGLRYGNNLKAKSNYLALNLAVYF